MKVSTSLLIVLISSVLSFLPEVIVPDCHCEQLEEGLVLHCTHLHSTRYLSHIRPLSASEVLSIQISASLIECLETRHFVRFSRLKTITVTNSMMRHVFCDSSNVELLADVEHLNFTNNRITQLGQDISGLVNLKSLDLSDNLLSESLEAKEFSSLPSSLTRLVMTQNIFSCVPALTWLDSWARHNSHLRDSLSEVYCRIRNSRQLAPLLQVVRLYSTQISPDCSAPCSCVLHHFLPGQDDYSSSYTVMVNCSHQGLTYFPTIPARTTLLDLSHNNLTSFASLSPYTQNYQHVSSLFLSHNQLSTIHTKLVRLKLDKSFRADHNLISDLPFEVSQYLQKYLKNEVSLGHNPWTCYCNAEITKLNVKIKIGDIDSMLCSPKSYPEELVGKSVLALETAVMCPSHNQQLTREAGLQILCAVLALANIATFSKLLFDYYQYKVNGKLPQIVHWIPSL